MQNMNATSSSLIQLWPLLALVLLYACVNQQTAEKNQPVNPPAITLELHPSNDNPRNSEGDFISLADGAILFVYSKYTGESTSDHAPASLAGRYSSDGGATWTDEDRIIVPNEGGMNVMSVSLLRLQNGEIALFYLRKNSTEDCIPMLRISRDEGKSWSEPRACITDKQGYFVLNNDRVIQLRDGRLLLAVAQHNAPGGAWNNRGTLYSYCSDDHGRTWTSSEPAPNPQEWLTQEPGLIELKDGRVMMYIRSDVGVQLISYSSDRGQTWSPVEKSNIPSPVSPAAIEQIPGTGDWLLAWNHNDGSDPAIQGKRTPMTLAISKNEGKTWEHVKNLEADPDGWYCYTAIHFPQPDRVLLAYCAGNRPAGTGLSVTHVAKVGLDWLYLD